MRSVSSVWRTCQAGGALQPNFAAVFLFLICTTAPCLAQTPALPAYVTLPAQIQLKPNSVQEDYGEAEFNMPGKPSAVQRGKHWYALLTLPSIPRSTDPEVIWAQIKPALVRGGWTVISDLAGQEKFARYQKDGHDSWFGLWVNSAEDLRLDLVEVGPPALKLKLNAPAAKPEVVSVGTGDFPYLSALPGSIPGSGHLEGTPMMIDVDLSKDTHEMEVVGSGSIIKSYTLPPPLRTTVLFATVYREALMQAGWTIVKQIQNVHSADAVLNAHYNANGRDLWASLHSTGRRLHNPSCRRWRRGHWQRTGSRLPCCTVWHSFRFQQSDVAPGFGPGSSENTRVAQSETGR